MICFFTNWQSRYAELAWSIQINGNWYKKSMIGMKIERYHMAKESNQISSKLKDWICFATLIHWGIYNEQKQSKKRGLEVVHSQEQNWKNSRKSVIRFSIYMEFQSISKAQFSSQTSQEAIPITPKSWNAQNRAPRLPQFV